MACKRLLECCAEVIEWANDDLARAVMKAGMHKAIRIDKRGGLPGERLSDPSGADSGNGGSTDGVGVGGVGYWGCRWGIYIGLGGLKGAVHGRERWGEWSSPYCIWTKLWDEIHIAAAFLVQETVVAVDA